MASLSSTSNSTVSTQYYDAAIALTGLIKDINDKWDDPGKRMYLIFKDSIIEETPDYNKSTSKVDFNRRLTRFTFHLSGGVRYNLQSEVEIYTQRLTAMESATSPVSRVPKIKRVVKKTTKTAKQAGIQPSKERTVRFAEISSHSKEPLKIASFSELTHDPMINIEDLTNTFQKAIKSSLRKDYYQDSREYFTLCYQHLYLDGKKAKEGEEEANLQKTINEWTKQASERMHYYLPGAFHQALSNITDLIDRSTIGTKEEAYKQFLNKFNKILEIYQSSHIADEKDIPPLGSHVMGSLHTLMREKATANALTTYFQQMLSEKAIAPVKREECVSER